MASGDTLSLATTGSGHNIAIGGNVTATSGTIDLNAAGGISETSGTLTATNVNLTSGTGSVSVHLVLVMRSKLRHLIYLPILVLMSMLAMLVLSI